MSIALIGLICIGLMGLGGILYFSQINQAQEEAAATGPAPTVEPPTFTPTSTPTETPTNTPEPTPTGTPVVDNGGDEEPAPEATEEPLVDTPTTDPNATPTNTRVLQTPTATATPDSTATPTPPSGTMPDSGGVLPAASNGYLLWAAGGLLLVLLGYGSVSRVRASIKPPQK